MPVYHVVLSTAIEKRTKELPFSLQSPLSCDKQAQWAEISPCQQISLGLRGKKGFASYFLCCPEVNQLGE